MAALQARPRSRKCHTAGEKALRRGGTVTARAGHRSDGTKLARAQPLRSPSRSMRCPQPCNLSVPGSPLSQARATKASNGNPIRTVSRSAVLLAICRAAAFAPATSSLRMAKRKESSTPLRYKFRCLIPAIAMPHPTATPFRTTGQPQFSNRHHVCHSSHNLLSRPGSPSKLPS
jgi:hypothetical protein